MFKRRKHANALSAVLNMPGGRPALKSLRIAGPESEVRTLVVLQEAAWVWPLSDGAENVITC